MALTFVNHDGSIGYSGCNISIQSILEMRADDKVWYYNEPYNTGDVTDTVMHYAFPDYKNTSHNILQPLRRSVTYREETIEFLLARGMSTDEGTLEYFGVLPPEPQTRSSQSGSQSRSLSSKRREIENLKMEIEILNLQKELAELKAK